MPRAEVPQEVCGAREITDLDSCPISQICTMLLVFCFVDKHLSVGVIYISYRRSNQVTIPVSSEE